MKKFRFTLDTVLDYKQQELDGLTIEHGVILAQVRRQEEVLADAELRYMETDHEFSQRKLEGLTIADAMGYEMGLRVLEQEIEREKVKLDELRLQEQQKREQVVEAKIDTTGLEKLKEKKLTIYNKELQKDEERFIDELVMLTRAQGGTQAAAI